MFNNLASENNENVLTTEKKNTFHISVEVISDRTLRIFENSMPPINDQQQESTRYVLELKQRLKEKKK